MAVADDFAEHLDVTSTRKITGSLREGATIRSGTQLTVLGAFVGPAIVETNAVLMVQGSFNGEIRQNDGTAILYGQVSVDLARPTGHLAVGIDSLVTTETGSYRLMPDGELVEVRGNLPAGSFNVRMDRLCLYDSDQRRFRPLGRTHG